MKDIKYKAWIESKKKLIDVYGFNEDLVFGNTSDWPFEDWELQNIFKRDDCILLQYIWFKDKNWKEIYEGYIFDSIYKNDWCKWKYIVEWNEESFWFYPKKVWEHQQKNVSIFIWDLQNLEIKWNIYENSDLIPKD